MKGIITVLGKLADAWTAYLNNKAEIYRVHLHENAKRANNSAEQGYERMDELIDYVIPFVPIKETKQFKHYVNRIKQTKRRFDKYD